MTDTNRADVADLLRGRFFGKYRGIVDSVDAATMRVRALVPAVLGETVSGWAIACVPYAGPNVGFVMLPEVQSGVWIEFEGGDPSYPIWTGCYWRSGEIPAEAAEDAKAIFTTAGKFVLDDGGASLTLEDTNGNKLVVDANGVLAQGSAAKIAIGSSASINDGALEVK